MVGTMKNNLELLKEGEQQESRSSTVDLEDGNDNNQALIAVELGMEMIIL